MYFILLKHTFPLTSGSLWFTTEYINIIRNIPDDAGHVTSGRFLLHHLFSAQRFICDGPPNLLWICLFPSLPLVLSVTSIIIIIKISYNIPNSFQVC